MEISIGSETGIIVGIVVMGAYLVTSVIMGKLPFYNPTWDLPRINIDDVRKYVINEKNS